ncbi:tRNA modification GTPase mnmE [Dirofilaria immitis]|nr:tRNA modification GTPase mnmE [Dirofilaria immitis]
MLESYMALRCLKRCSSIFAVSSGALPAAISIIRISGWKRKLTMPTGTHGSEKILPRHLFYTHIRRNGELIDRGMALDNDPSAGSPTETLLRLLPGPRTPTGEDMAEFYVHGSRAVVDCLLDTLAQFDNMQPAKAGEFTKRAFFNGKMTLQEVQSLAYLLAARTQRQRRLALRMNTLGKKQLIEVRASVEASIDFGDDVGFQLENIRFAVKSTIENLSSIQEQMHRGTLISEGLRIVILANRDMAIVSHIEGTTRDSLEATVQLSSIPVTIVDTAGIREIPWIFLKRKACRGHC